MFKHMLGRGPLRWSGDRKRRSVHSRPGIAGLESRQLMSLNVFTVASGTETTAITKGPHGNLFFTETAANKIGEITSAGVVTEFTIPTPNSQPTAITTGANGNLYFTQPGLTSAGELEVGEITPLGKITQLVLPKQTLPPVPAPPSSATSARLAVGSTANQTHVAAVDAAIEGLAAGDGQGSATASTAWLSVVDPTKTTNGHKK